MKTKIIYERRYERPDLLAEMEAAEEMDEEVDCAFPSFDELLKEIEENTTYALIPERVNSSEEFVKIAIEVSQIYQIDTVIMRHPGHISVTYFLRCGGGMREINQLFGMADEFSFFREETDTGIIISMDYYTHYVMRRGKIVAPDII